MAQPEEVVAREIGNDQRAVQGRRRTERRDPVTCEGAEDQIGWP